MTVVFMMLADILLLMLIVPSLNGLFLNWLSCLLNPFAP